MKGHGRKCDWWTLWPVNSFCQFHTIKLSWNIYFQWDIQLQNHKNLIHTWNKFIAMLKQGLCHGFAVTQNLLLIGFELWCTSLKWKGKNYEILLLLMLFFIGNKNKTKAQPKTCGCWVLSFTVPRSENSWKLMNEFLGSTEILSQIWISHLSALIS